MKGPAYRQARQAGGSGACRGHLRAGKLKTRAAIMCKVCSDSRRSDLSDTLESPLLESGGTQTLYKG